jgi:electron transport complex protein RnfD
MLFSGGLILGAVYMATDMATSPVTPRGMWVYGALIGLLTVVIRYYSGLPEGVMYAILIANAATPLIERITQPTPFGKGLLDPLARATYPLHPDYISREEAGAVTPKKRFLKNKPKP